MKLAIALLALLLLSLEGAPALAQSTTTSGPDLRRSAQGRTGTQNLSGHQDVARRGGAERPAARPQHFSGTGRPVAAPPAPTPAGRPAAR